MYEIYFYKDKNGEEPVKDYLLKLEQTSGKDNRIKYNKIHEYIQLLATYGTRIGEPYVKFLNNKIWELRPGGVRILFTVHNAGYILLHSFVKTTQKTPKKEIEKAQNRAADI